MYQDDVSVINIQASQLVQIMNQVQNTCISLTPLADQEQIDKDSMKAYIASADILMTSLSSQQILLQQALDKLAKELAG